MPLAVEEICYLGTSLTLGLKSLEKNIKARQLRRDLGSK